MVLDVVSTHSWIIIWFDIFFFIFLELIVRQNTRVCSKSQRPLFWSTFNWNQLETSSFWKELEGIGNLEDYIHCPQCNLSLILFLSFFISFLNVSFLVKDLFRFTVANEQDQGDKDENQGGPWSTKAETKLPNSPMTWNSFKT